MTGDVVHLPAPDLDVTTIVDDTSTIDPSTSEATSPTTFIKCPVTMLSGATSPNIVTLRSTNHHAPHHRLPLTVREAHHQTSLTIRVHRYRMQPTTRTSHCRTPQIVAKARPLAAGTDRHKDVNNLSQLHPREVKNHPQNVFFLIHMNMGTTHVKAIFFHDEDHGISCTVTMTTLFMA
jgi:hypothetical protein